MRGIPYVLLGTLAVVASLVIVTRADAKPHGIGGLIAQAQAQTWRCQDSLGETRIRRERSPWTYGDAHAYGRWVAKRWTARLADCSERQRQWRWEGWLPDKWRRIGVCETGLNWRHSNSSYQGAFGFAIRSWDDYKLPGYPDEAWQATPWQQYQVALAIYDRFGLSGWGCRNA